MGGKGRGSEGEAGQKFGSIVAVSAMLGYTDGADIKNPAPVASGMLNSHQYSHQGLRVARKSLMGL